MGEIGGEAGLLGRGGGLGEGAEEFDRGGPIGAARDIGGGAGDGAHGEGGAIAIGQRRGGRIGISRQRLVQAFQRQHAVELVGRAGGGGVPLGRVGAGGFHLLGREGPARAHGFDHAALVEDRVEKEFLVRDLFHISRSTRHRRRSRPA